MVVSGIVKVPVNNRAQLAAKNLGPESNLALVILAVWEAHMKTLVPASARMGANGDKIN